VIHEKTLKDYIIYLTPVNMAREAKFVEMLKKSCLKI